jgi:hypothetical protein
MQTSHFKGVRTVFDPTRTISAICRSHVLRESGQYCTAK